MRLIILLFVTVFCFSCARKCALKNNLRTGKEGTQMTTVKNDLFMDSDEVETFFKELSVNSPPPRMEFSFYYKRIKSKIQLLEILSFSDPKGHMINFVHFDVNSDGFFDVILIFDKNGDLVKELTGVNITIDPTSTTFTAFTEPKILSPQVSKVRQNKRYRFYYNTIIG